MKKVLILLLFSIMALGLSAQTPISTQSGIVPVHNLRVEDTTYFGQLIGIWAIDAGDTMFGFVPVYVLPDSTLLVGSDTVYSSGNPQVITLSGDVTGSGTSSIVTNIAAGAVGATELQTGAVTTVKIAASAVDSTKIGVNAVGPSELQSTAVTPGSYTLSSVTVDADGRLTAASNGTVNLASQVTGTLPVANGGTGATSLSGAGIATTATGTVNYVPKYTAGTVLGNSQISDDGTSVKIGTYHLAPRFGVYDAKTLSSSYSNTAEFYGINGTNDPGIRIRHSTVGSDIQHSWATGAPELSLSVATTKVMSMFISGNVGIGTSSPSQRLHVSGNIFSDGTNAQFLGDDAVNSVTTPTYSFSGDTDNGIYRPAADNIGLVTGGTERIRILSSGNVGIGTITPSRALHVNGSIRADGEGAFIDNRNDAIITQSASTVASNRDLTLGVATYGRFMAAFKTYSLTTGTHAALGTYLWYLNGETNTGGGAGLSIYFRPQAPSVTNQNGGDFLIDLPNGTGTGRSGRVGIATIAPTNTIDVNGTARIRTFTGTPKRIIGADLSGVLDTLVLGSGLSITSGTLNTTNNGTITSIATSAPLTGGPITSTGTIGITQANSTTNGFISSTDWNTFNNKLSAEVDGSTTNELQNLSLTGQSLGISSGSGVTLPIIDVAAGTGVTVSKTGGVATVSATSTGTVSSVGLTMPSGFTVSNSPVTTSGTLAVTTTLNGPLRGNGSGLTTGNTNLASEVTGTLPVANGGTGVTTLTANKVLVGNGTSAFLSPTNLHWDNTNSRLGISETSPAYPLDINAITAIRLPRGTDGQQPAAAAGLFRFSTTTNTVDWSDGTNWYKGISGEGQGPSSSFNRIALWSGASTQTSDADLTFNPSTGQLKMLKYTSASTFAGTSVAELHVTSTGEVITKSPRDTQYVHLVAVTPGTAVTQTAGHDFYQGSFLMPEHLDNYTLSRADYAITNSTATTGSLTVRIRYYDTTNSGGSTACAVTFTGADVRESSTNGLVMPKGYWMHAEVGSTNGTLNNTVEGLLVTLMFTK